MQINLDENEVSAVLEALNYYLPNLRDEVYKTENYDMRESLKAQEAAIKSVIAKLGGSVAESTISDIGAKNPPWGG
jgi:hypothetical protein